MKKLFWKWLCYALDYTGTLFDQIARWFENAALWVLVNKRSDGSQIPLERWRTQPTGAITIAEAKLMSSFCTCKWSETPASDPLAMNAHQRDIDPSCPIHGTSWQDQKQPRGW